MNASMTEERDELLTNEPDAPADLPATYLKVRSAVDFVFAAVMLVLTGPLILLLMALVKLTSQGPAIYKQVRAGLGGVPYTIYKLRSMAENAERDGARWSGQGDTRITPLGHFLRKTHLDELPQLWNVLRGDMSLIGPRPERPCFVETLSLAYPEYKQRMAVKPGVTGLAQIQLPADEELAGVGRKLACDLCYIRNMGPWLDVRILVGTALKVLGFRLGTIRTVLWLPTDEAFVPSEGVQFTAEVVAAGPSL